MNRIHPHSFGLALGIFLALWHSLWSVLVWIGAAQWLIDFIFQLHMISPPYKITAFSFGKAVELVLVTACSGYVFGWIIGAIWNRCALRVESK